MQYILYNNDHPIARFSIVGGTVRSYSPYAKQTSLLPMQIVNADLLCGCRTDPLI